MKTTQEILNAIRIDESGTPITARESSQQALNAVYDESAGAIRIKNIGSVVVGSDGSKLGVYDSDYSYSVNDITTEGGIIYLCLLANTPASPKSPALNSDYWKPYLDTLEQSLSLGNRLFLDDTASDIPTYYTLSESPTGGAEQADSVIVNNNSALIEAYATPSGGLGVSSIPSDLWVFDVWCSVSSTVGISEILIDVYKRTSGGTETLLFSVTTGDINSTIPQLVKITSVQDAFAIDITDRLVVKFTAQTDRVINTTITIYHNGTSHYSLIETPSLLTHNSISEKQGGTAGEYYHLTSAEHDAIIDNGAGVGVDYIELDIFYEETGDEPVGVMMWEPTTETVIIRHNSNVLGQVNHQLLVSVSNQAGFTITKGTPVMVIGTLGASERLLVYPMISDDTWDSAYFIGLAAETIPNGNTGKVLWFGKLGKIDTTGTAYGEIWTDGDPIYISPYYYGFLTNIIPPRPLQTINIGNVLHSHATNGLLAVRPLWQGKIEYLDNINIIDVSDNQLLFYENETGNWINKTLTASDTSDFDTEVSNNIDVDANTTARHTHSNKTELDLITDGDHDVRTDNPHNTDIGNLGSGTLSELNTALSDATLIDTSDSRLSDARIPIVHASNHTDGTDDIQDATASQKGLATATQITKLDAIESGAKANWHPITDFTATPASTSTLTLTSDLTATIKPGVGLKYTIGGTDYYGSVTAITSNLLTIAGASFSGDVSAIYWTHIKPIYIFLECRGEFAESASSDLFADYFPPGNPLWEFGKAFFVKLTQKTTSDDSGATIQPAVNVVIAGNNALSTALTIPDGTQNSSVVQLTPANCVIENGNSLALSITAASGGTPANDAKDLFVLLEFITEMP